MRKKSTAQLLGFAEWVERADPLPKGMPETRNEAMCEAMREFADFARLENGSPDDLTKVLREPIELICSDLRKDLRQQHGSAPPAQTRKRLQRVAKLLLEANTLIAEDWQAGARMMFHFEAEDEAHFPREFAKALRYSVELVLAAQRAAEDKKERVVNTLAGRKSGNSAILVFLCQCRVLMATVAKRNVPLRKTDGPLLRFARPLFRHATGLLVADGAFDREVDELRLIPLTEILEGKTHS